MIYKDVLLEKRITEANTVIVSRPSIDNSENPIAFKNGNSAVVYEFPQNNFEEWLENPTLTFIKSFPKEIKDIEDIFVSPVKSSIKVKMKVRIGGKFSQPSIDEEEIVYLDDSESEDMVYPIRSSIKVKIKARIASKSPQPPIDEEDF